MSVKTLRAVVLGLIEDAGDEGMPDEDLLDRVLYTLEATQYDVDVITKQLFDDGLISRETRNDSWRVTSSGL